MNDKMDFPNSYLRRRITPNTLKGVDARVAQRIIDTANRLCPGGTLEINFLHSLDTDPFYDVVICHLPLTITPAFFDRFQDLNEEFKHDPIRDLKLVFSKENVEMAAIKMKMQQCQDEYSPKKRRRENDRGFLGALFGSESDSD